MTQSVDGWLHASELRIGLGCMRMSTDEHRDEDVALQTIAAAARSGITVFDTARAYGQNEAELGHNEKLLARALRRAGAEGRTRIVTKGGMARTGGAWIPDGRARTILGDCEKSLGALDGLAIDLYLLHAPDPRTPWRTSVRALNRLVDEGAVGGVGLANVNLGQLNEALDLVPVTAVQVSLSVYDDRSIRAGVVERCAELGIAVIAHSPLGGPRRARGLTRRQALVDIAAAHGATPAEVALAWLLGFSQAVIAIPGARRPETARSAAAAAQLRLSVDERAALEGARRSRVRGQRASSDDADVVLVMGIPGAGKSRVADEYVARGYVRLNRDERGGTLQALADALEEQLASGARRLVLDNTYLDRVARSYVIEAAGAHGVAARCIWVDTPLAQAQVNMVERLLERFGSLPTPEELRALARREPGMLLPTSQMRALRELEPPSIDEGFHDVEQVPFAREPATGRTCAGVFIAAASLTRPGWERALEQSEERAPHLLFDWRPDGAPGELAADVARVASEVPGTVESALCAHGGGPPNCWCRPPLPGLLLAFARNHGVDPSSSILIGVTPAHRTLAATIGARYVSV